jgi:hypothetical protein
MPAAVAGDGDAERSTTQRRKRTGGGEKCGVLGTGGRRFIFFFGFIFRRGFNAGALQLLAWLEEEDDSRDPGHVSLLLLWREMAKLEKN